MCQEHPNGDFFVQEGFLSKGTRLCIPKYSTRDLLIREVRGGSLAGHLGESKTIIMLRETLLLARNGEGCSKYPKEMWNVPSC